MRKDGNRFKVSGGPEDANDATLQALSWSDQSFGLRISGVRNLNRRCCHKRMGLRAGGFHGARLLVAALLVNVPCRTTERQQSAIVFTSNPKPTKKEGKIMAHHLNMLFFYMP